MLRANEGEHEAEATLYGIVSRPAQRPASGGSHTLAAAAAVWNWEAAGRLAMHRRIVMSCA
jgi:hypothetical protein